MVKYIKTPYPTNYCRVKCSTTILSIGLAKVSSLLLLSQSIRGLHIFFLTTTPLFSADLLSVANFIMSNERRNLGPIMIGQIT